MAGKDVTTPCSTEAAYAGQRLKKRYSRKSIGKDALAVSGGVHGLADLFLDQMIGRQPTFWAFSTRRRTSHFYKVQWGERGYQTLGPVL